MAGKIYMVKSAGKAKRTKSCEAEAYQGRVRQEKNEKDVQGWASGSALLGLSGGKCGTGLTVAVLLSGTFRDAAKSLDRPFPKAVAGTIKSFAYDPFQKALKLTWPENPMTGKTRVLTTRLFQVILYVGSFKVPFQNRFFSGLKNFLKYLLTIR